VLWIVERREGGISKWRPNRFQHTRQSRTARSPDLEVLEARIRRLEQGGQGRTKEAQTFGAGLRALQERGLRGDRGPHEPLH